MNQTVFSDHPQPQARTRPGMFAAPGARIIPLSTVNPAILAQMVGPPPSPGQADQSPPRPPSYDGMAQGAATRTAAAGMKSAAVRRTYEQRVASLDPADTLARSAIKAQARSATPPEVLAPLQRWRPTLGPLAGSGGSANISNMGVNQVARTLGRIGKGAGILGAVLALDDILTSPNHRRALVANVGAGLGGFIGGAGGAALGTLTGPAAVVATPAGGLAGSIAGGRVGYKAGEDVYDAFSNW